jgi:tripartite-type tricarboxylate transporter receptor subunit TctC
MRVMVRWFSAALLTIAALASSAAQADPVADFYKGKQIQLVVGYGPGGGNDVYARLLARHMGRHIPGNPGIVVQNMPGAGSLRAANYLYNVAPKDGTVFGTFARNMPLLSALGDNASVQFDPSNFTWLGSSSSYADDAYILFVRPDAAVNSIHDARRPDGPTLVLSGTAPGDTSADVPLLLRDALGLKVKLVMGYPDSNAMFMAAETKEVDGRVADLSSVASSRPHWLKPGGMRALLQFARMSRHAAFPDVPTARELATSDADRTIIEISELPYRLTRPYAAPPGVPAERAKALQSAFMAVHKDPQYLDEAAKLKLDISPIDGAEILKVVEQIGKAPPAVLERIKRLQAENKGG